MIEEIEDKKSWNDILSKVDSYDFYHTYDYHQLSKQPNEKFLLLVYQTDIALIAIPVVLRPIEGTDYFDITSVYGYPGPVSKNITGDFDNQLFVLELNKYFLNHNVVSVFSRLNPYINHQKEILKNMGKCVDLSSVVFINLTNNLDTQRSGYQKRIKTQINKARRLCDIVKATKKEDIDAFIDIYYENMNRVNADDYYYFDKDYFYNFLNSDNFETDLLLAITKETNEIIAGVIFVKTNHIVQYHLAGSKSDFLNITPIKILIDEMRIIATEEGFKYLNLGGGLGSKEDSLLRFKISFSKELKTFSVWKYIVDHETYNMLTSGLNPKSTDYFPAYRRKLA
ncbi:GNAT family N-acetyltransferase [Paucihalobacter sp.]|uniref:GNAT family N-acetyltransferase n=1 Tax=Paucihalobacter sp. TaxID=2850405 RepID=UPI002FE18E08